MIRDFVTAVQQAGINPGAEGVSGQCYRQIKSALEIFQTGPDILLLPFPFVEMSAALAGSPEIEP